MKRRPPRATRTDIPIPNTTLFRSCRTRRWYRRYERAAVPAPSAPKSPHAYREGASLAVAVKQHRSEEHTSELPSLMRTSYAVFCLKKKRLHDYANLHTPIIYHSRTTNLNVYTPCTTTLTIYT